MKFILSGNMFTQPFQEGIQACIDGKSIDDNPYDIFLGGSWNRHSQWADGFWDAQDVANDEFDINFEVKEYMQKIGYKFNTENTKEKE
jgi:ribosome modulation factor